MTAQVSRQARLFAVIVTVILVLLAGFQLMLILGAPLGEFAWGGQHRVLPAGLRVGSAVSILIYGLIDVVVWDRVGAVNVFPASLSAGAIWVVFGYFVLAVVMNAISRSAGERQVMVPVALMLALLVLLIATRTGAPNPRRRKTAP